MDLNKILQRGIHNLAEDYKKTAKEQANGILRGSNVPLFIDGKFISSESEHCPRKAIFRSKYGIIDTKNQSSIISHKTGRVVEEVFKEIINSSGENDLSYIQEEEAQITVKDVDDNTIFTARPDIVFTHHKRKYILELKSIQSSNSFFQISIDKVPKCGAVLQASTYHILLNIEKGFIAYVLYYYLDGYNMKTKSRVKSAPMYEIFNTELRDDGLIYVDGNHTIISKDRIQNGIMALHEYLKQDIIPPRPEFTTVFGRPAKYSPCNYCHLKNVCNLIDSNNVNKFNDLPEEIIDA